MSDATLDVDSVRFVKELYPRVREDEAAVERYRAAIDLLPPIAVARDGILVDGYHRLLAHRREGRTEIAAEHLGDLADVEIVKESIRRNAAHGRQLETSDKRRNADLLYRQGTRDYAEIAALLSVTVEVARKYAADARRDEKAEQQTTAWELWLDCHDFRRIAATLDGPDEDTVSRWISAKRNEFQNADAPASRQHFDVWTFGTDGTDSKHFGKMPPAIVENLLWLWTEPGQVVVDPFAGGGTTIDVAKRMGRRVWASDLHPSTETLPIHAHDITAGWPDAAPKKADFILLDPPYWKQAAGRYSDDAADLGNMALDDFMAAWALTVKTCASHLIEGGALAFIVSPAQDGGLADGVVVDLAFEMYRAAVEVGLDCERRIIVPYNTQQATGQQVESAREHRKLLKLYRDLVVMRP